MRATSLESETTFGYFVVEIGNNVSGLDVVRSMHLWQLEA